MRYVTVALEKHNENELMHAGSLFTVLKPGLSKQHLKGGGCKNLTHLQQDTKQNSGLLFSFEGLVGWQCLWTDMLERPCA